MVKPLSLWRVLAPVRGLIFLIVFHLLVSFGYIVFFSRAFGFGKRIVALHLVVISVLIAAATLGLGALLLFRRFREWRLAKFALALLPATWLSVLVVLYFADYTGNALWGSNVNYELAVQYLSGKGLFQQELRLLPNRTYLALAGSLAVIFSIHLLLAGPLLRGLAELFLPGRELSLLRDRRRAARSGAGLLLGLSVLGCVGYLSASVEARYRDRILNHEPIIGFFIDPNGLIGFINYTTRVRLEAEEQRNRAGYPSGQTFTKKNVVMIMVDTLRADHMQVYGYKRHTTPFLASLLKTGRLRKIDLALSACADTNCGVMATLSSKPLKKQIPQSFKLPDLLHDQGYQVHFILAGSHRWYNLKAAYGASVTSYFDGANSSRYDWNDDRVIFEGLEKAPDFSGAPAFFYFHVMAPHSTGVRQEQHRVYLPSKSWVEFRKGELDSGEVTNFYDNGVIQADAVIEGIFEALQRKGYLTNSVVIILSDHGEGLGPPDHSRYGHVNYLYQEFIRIPLLIYDDAEVKYANLRFATQIDVAPTILDRLGLLIPPSWRGQSLLVPDSREYSFHVTNTYLPNYAVIYKTDRAIYKYLNHYALGEELFELTCDPQEKRNLMGVADPALIERMRGKLAEYLAADYPDGR